VSTQCERQDTMLPLLFPSQHQRVLPIEVHLEIRLNHSIFQPAPENSIHLVVPLYEWPCYICSLESENCSTRIRSCRPRFTKCPNGIHSGVTIYTTCACIGKYSEIETEDHGSLGFSPVHICDDEFLVKFRERTYRMRVCIHAN
jgi:hypothetical protein